MGNESKRRWVSLGTASDGHLHGKHVRTDTLTSSSVYKSTWKSTHHKHPNSSAASMRTWTSLTVLSVAVVSTLSFPRPDAEYKIPTVGLGARSQFYVLHDDGTFKYGYDTGDGIYESAMANAPGDVSGSYGYKDASGADIKLDYTANDQGFLVSGSHLPVAPRVDAASPVSTKSVVSTYDAPSAPSRPAASSQPSALSQHAATSAPVEEAQVRSSALDDGSYSFSYETQISSRYETADALNNVKGRYSFTADDDVNREIQYVAGAETGYIAEGDSLPRGPSVPRNLCKCKIVTLCRKSIGDAPCRGSPLSRSRVHVFGDAAPGVAASPAYSAPSRSSTVPVAHTASPSAITKAAGSPATSGSHTSQVVGDVLLHQYSGVNNPKFGYVFTAFR
ncbi:uncharacterized protein LOC122259415 [Penaeus japonicus]|uniref:uncharacterized protein LOC122259415 n=1 Tax=Penaeus japonicus TaxID=27405 RepID=UPI001C710FB2|nr:uncharacterized protein LOC122259415 [Penaeus japonicus]